MNKRQFKEEYEKILNRSILFSEKARREGMLALEDELNISKVKQKDVFELALKFVIDGTDQAVIEKICLNLINQENNKQLKTLKTIQMVAALSIQAGENTRIMKVTLNSYTDFPLPSDTFND